jgi:hypothetical protein
MSLQLETLSDEITYFMACKYFLISHTICHLIHTKWNINSFYAKSVLNKFKAQSFLDQTLRLFWNLQVHYFGVCRLLMMVSCLAYSSTLKMEAICSSEMSDSLQLYSIITLMITLHAEFFS